MATADCTRRSFLASAALGAAACGLAGAAGASAAWADEAANAQDLTWGAVYDVVIIGFGGAGAAAAISAADEGASVLLVDKAPEGHHGGNTRYCMQVMTAVEPDKQEEALTYYQALRGKRSTPSDEVLAAWIAESAQNREWLTAMGANLVPRYETYPGEYPEYDPHGSIMPMTIDGAYFDSALWRFLAAQVEKRSDLVDTWYGAPAVKLLRDPQTGVVLGATVLLDGTEVNVRARNGVVLSCGGFEANPDMVQDYAGVDDCLPLGTAYNTGDGIKMASAIGANLWHLSNIMGPYLQFWRPGDERAEFYSGTLMATNLVNEGYIMVAADGRRFMNDHFNPRHGYIESHGTWQHTPAPQPTFMVFDQACLEQTPMIAQSIAGNNLDRQVEAGFVYRADTVEELGSLAGLDPATLAETVQRYNDACAAGYDPEFKREPASLLALETPPFYAVPLRPAMINSQGGPERNKDAQIVDAYGVPIPHLYGAGECGVIFSGPYQGGSNIADCVGTGRLAGRNAAAPKDDSPAFDESAVVPVAPAPKEEPVYECGPNQYVGSAEGISGRVVVRVTVNDGTIEQVEVVEHAETDAFGGRAAQILPARFEGVSVDDVMGVDGMSLATITSSAIKLAVSNALEQI